MVNVGTALEKAWSKFQDNSDALRAKMVVWFNEVAADIQNQPRRWFFLETLSTSLTITASAFTLPSGWREVLSIHVGDTFLYPEHQLTQGEADGQSGDDDAPAGYTVSPAGVVTLYPTTTGTAVVRYTADTSVDYIDSDDTAYPDKFEPLFISGMRMHYYDYFKDGRFGKEATTYQMEMAKMKAWDNRLLLAATAFNRPGSKQGAV